jgi:hypothetical protein
VGGLVYKPNAGRFVKTVTKFGFRKREGISVLPVNAIHPSAALMTY